jgi:hypothetical protein
VKEGEATFVVSTDAGAVQQKLVSRHEEADRLRRQHLERAPYEADLAQRRFLKVD